MIPGFCRGARQLAGKLVNAGAAVLCRGGVVLTILGVLGVLTAGVIADAAFFGRSPEQEEEGDPADLLEDPDGQAFDLETGPQSDDLAHEAEAGRQLYGSAGGEVLSGGTGDDRIEAGDGADLIDGRDGDDWIDAGFGDDAGWGGGGDDRIQGGGGHDSLTGQAGDDTILGGDGDDSILGDLGEDSLSGDAGNDTLLGGAGDDTQSGGAGDDWLAGGDGDDRLAGGDGADILDGGSGNDWLSGLDGDADDLDEDFLNGGAGNDSILLGAGDHATGGEGEDVFLLAETGPGGELAEIADYNALQDQLVVMYDPALHSDPVLGIMTSADATQSTILLNGKAVALVRGSALDADDVRLVAFPT